MNKRNLGIRDVVFIGVLSSMCVIATTIKIPFGAGAMVHLGSASIFLAGILFGGVYAGMSGALGSALFDLVMGHSPYTVWSFFIKGIAGFIVGTVAAGLWPESSPVNKPWILRAVLGCILAAAWTLGGYIVAWSQVTGSMGVALSNSSSSLMTSGVGFFVAMLLASKLRRAIKK